MLLVALAAPPTVSSPPSSLLLMPEIGLIGGAQIAVTHSVVLFTAIVSVLSF